MSFFSRFSTIGNRTLARVIAEQFAKKYIEVRKVMPKASKEEHIRETLRQMIKWPSAQELASSDFLSDKKNLDLVFVIYSIAVEESPVNKRRLSIPANQIDAYNEEITNVLKEHGLYDQ